MRYILTTAPASEPVTIDEVKTHCRVDHDDEDLLLLEMIQSARESAEKLNGRVFINQTWTLKMDGFPGSEIELRKLPIQSVSSVKYIDENGVLQTVSTADYVVDLSGITPRIYLAYDASWPVPRSEPNAVRVEFVAGYGDEGSDVPANYRSWILLRVGELYAHREGTVVGTIANRLPFVDSLVLSDRIGF
jgi:uncharacterized phiE125 gp8 family phage protein